MNRVIVGSLIGVLIAGAVACGGRGRGDDEDNESDGGGEPDASHWIGTDVSLIAGERDSCLLTESVLYCWGDVYDSNVPRTYEGVTDGEQVALGGLHGCGRRTDGSLWCWGRGLDGQLGDNTGEHRAVPIQVPGLSGVVWVDAGTYHTCAALDDGSVWCFGANDGGQIGDGTDVNRHAPVEVEGVSDVVEVAVGWHLSCARHSDGRVSCWGDDVESRTPIQIAGISTAQQLSAGMTHACARLEDGTMKCWGGQNFMGQLGNGTTEESRSTAVTVTGLEDVVDIGTGSYHSCALHGDGSVSCWGSNDQGQLGSDDGTNYLEPHLVGELPEATQLASSLGNHACVLTTEWEIWCWGSNFGGQLGDGTNLDRHLPVRVQF